MRLDRDPARGGAGVEPLEQLGRVEPRDGATARADEAVGAGRREVEGRGRFGPLVHATLGARVRHDAARRLRRNLKYHVARAGRFDLDQVAARDAADQAFSAVFGARAPAGERPTACPSARLSLSGGPAPCRPGIGLTSSTPRPCIFSLEERGEPRWSVGHRRSSRPGLRRAGGLPVRARLEIGPGAALRGVARTRATASTPTGSPGIPFPTSERADAARTRGRVMMPWTRRIPDAPPPRPRPPRRGPRRGLPHPGGEARRPPSRPPRRARFGCTPSTAAAIWRGR